MNKDVLIRISVVSIIFLMSISLLIILDVKGQEENTWTSLAPLQQARGALGVAVANDKIYAIRGIGGSSSITDINEEYNPITDTWTYKEPIPTPRSHFAITTYENKIYCIGGNTYTLDPVEFILTGVNEVYDPIANTWETKAPLPNIKRAITANVIDNKIYVVGDESNELWMYTPETDQWTRKPSISSTPTLIRGSWSCSSAVINNKLHVIWGPHQVYDPTTNSWSLASSTPKTPLYGSAGSTIGVNSPSRFSVFGVDYKDWNLNLPNFVSFSYDSKTDSWSTFDPMPTKRVGFGVAVVDDQVYTIGGYTLDIGNNIDRSGVNERYTPLQYGLAPVIVVTSPENKTYGGANILLSVDLDKISELKYSLDGFENVTFTQGITLSDLEVGEHNVTVYATDLIGHIGAPEIIYFSIEPFPTTIVLVSVAAIVVVGLGILTYFKKYRK